MENSNKDYLYSESFLNFNVNLLDDFDSKNNPKNEIINQTQETKNFSNISVQNSTNLSSVEIPIHFLQMSENSKKCVIAYCVLFIIAATGNFTVFVTVLRHLKRGGSRMSLLIVHLAVADLCVTFGVILLEIIWRVNVEWNWGSLGCKFAKFLSAFGLYLSSYLLISITLDRYFAILHPLWLSHSRRRGKLMVQFSYIIASLSSVPQLFIFEVKSHPIYTSFKQCVSFGFFTSPTQELLYNLFSISLMYFIPLLVVIYTYLRIFIKISQKSKQQRETIKRASVRGMDHSVGILLRRSDGVSHMERAKSKTLRLTLVIVIVFVLCWTPYALITLWYMIDRESAVEIDPQVQDGLFIMAVANSCVNPLVYGSFTKECSQTLSFCNLFKKQNNLENRRRIELNMTSFRTSHHHNHNRSQGSVSNPPYSQSVTHFTSVFISPSNSPTSTSFRNNSRKNFISTHSARKNSNFSTRNSNLLDNRRPNIHSLDLGKVLPEINTPPFS